MGRATWLESKIHLPHARTTAVLTNNEIFRRSLKSMPNVVTVGSLDEGLEVADEAVRRDEIVMVVVCVCVCLYVQCKGKERIRYL